jgi:Ca2+-binding EF-hand superfamily protein
LAFHRYDDNGDGELDVEEIKPVFRAVEVADKDANQKFTELDTDKNHKVSSVI